MSFTVGGSTPQLTFADATVQNTAFTGLNQSATPFATSLGYQALNSNTGTNNTAVGYQSLLSNTTATSNTAVGYQAGYTNSTGTGNTFLGFGAGYYTTSSNNTFVGVDSGQAITTGTKNTVIGRYDGTLGGLNITTASNYIVLSDGDGNPKIYFEPSTGTHFGGSSSADTTLLYSFGTYNYASGGSANLGINSSGFMYRSTSSLKYKQNVQNAVHGLAEVMQLRPVTYESKQQNESGVVYGGLIAEEVHAVGLTEFVQYAKDGTPDALAYSNMVSLCIKAIQEQQALITQLQADVAALKGQAHP